MTILQKLLDSLRSPYGLALDHFRVGLEAGNKKWLLYGRDGQVGVKGGVEGELDGSIFCTMTDLERMLSKKMPEEAVKLTMGERPGPLRKRQARGLLVAACLGWAGPWPDTETDGEHERLYRRAFLDLRLGPEDERQKLFPNHLPLKGDLRKRMEVDGPLYCTEGLSEERGFPEFWCRKGHPRWLRIAALAWKEGPFSVIDTEEGSFSVHTEMMPLPRGHRRLLEIRREA